jgi:hypothetical protein
MSEEKRSAGIKRSLFFIVVIFLLLSLMGNLFLLYEWTNQMSQLDKNEVDMKELDQANFKLEKDLERTVADLNEYMGMNAELDSMVSGMNVQLEEFKQQVNELTSSNSYNKAQRRKLEKKLSEMRNIYLARVDSLIAVNTELDAANKTLSQNLRLVESEREVLSEQVALASVLKARGFQVTAFKVKGSGKRVTTTKAKRTSVLKLCFDIEDNPVAESGKKDVLAKITGPKGIVLFRESAGSGLFKTSDTDKDSKYTLKEYVEYDRSRQNVCMDWSQENPFDPGMYKLEIYCEGFFAGEVSFELE